MKDIKEWEELKDLLTEEKVRTYYEEAGIELESRRDREWVKGRAPWDDSQKMPAFLVNLKTGNWRDLRRGKNGTILDFEVFHNGIGEQEAKERLLKRFKENSDKSAPIELSEAELAHIQKCYEEYRNYLQTKEGELVKSKLRKLGVSDEVMDSLGLGYQKKIGDDPPRLVFPIKDRRGRLINLRKYSKIGAPQVKDQEGCGIPIALYGIDEILARPNDPVLFVGSEKDKIVAMSYFPEYVVVTSTNSKCFPPQDKSEDVWKDRKVTICLDTSIPEPRIRELTYYMQLAAEKNIVRWPEKFLMMFEKGDLSDFLLWEHGGEDTIRKLLETPQIIREKDHLTTVAEDLPIYMAELEEVWKRKEEGKLIGFDTGFAQLNKVTEGLEPGTISIFISIPGPLKTTWCKQLCDQTAERAEEGDFIFYVALDGHPRFINIRSLARLSGYTMNDIQTGYTLEGKKVDKATLEACLKMYSKVFKRQILVHQACFEEKLTPSMIEKLISQKMNEMKVSRGLLIIDPLNHLGSDELNLDDTTRFNTNLRILSNMAIRLNLHILTVVVMSRARYQKAVKDEDYNTSHIVIGRKGGVFDYEPQLLFVLDCDMKTQDNWEVTLHLVENKSTGWIGKIDYVYFPANAEFEEEK